MYVRRPNPQSELTQGDVIQDCPLVYWTENSSPPGWQLTQSQEMVVVLTQACDLANARVSRVQVAVLHSTSKIVERQLVKASTIRDQVRLHKVYGWYFLPEEPELLPESVVDLRDVHTLPRKLLEELVVQGNRRIRISTPYREHLAHHFGITYSRIALPDPYQTK